jgi:hypothetical protein
MTKSTRELPNKSNKIRIVLIVLAVLAILVGVKVIYDHQKPPQTDSWTIPKIENPNRNRPPELKNQDMATPESSETTQPAPEAEPALTPCQETAATIKTFYNHLAEQNYIKAYELSEPVGDHINKIVIKLLNNPPVITAETTDFFTLLKNTAHFYRILGPKDLSFIKDILSYENNDVEDLMATFYRWSEFKNCQADINLQLSLGKLYEHASFFLNTLGGQSYLFRRDSKIRILTKYYCLLIVDRAAKQGGNKYDIDVSSVAKSIIKDMQDADVLENQEDYIQTLRSLNSKPAIK